MAAGAAGGATAGGCCACSARAKRRVARTRLIFGRVPQALPPGRRTQQHQRNPQRIGQQQVHELQPDWRGEQQVGHTGQQLRQQRTDDEESLPPHVRPARGRVIA